MQQIFSLLRRHHALFILASALFVVLGSLSVAHASARADSSAPGGRLITFHDLGEDHVILTHAQTVAAALAGAHIRTSKQDVVEPAITTKFTATDYTINIYRARPIIVVDGASRQKIITAAQDPKNIVADAGSTLHDEDTTAITPNTNVINDGASEVLTIHRATSFTLLLYGTPITAYTQAKTVGTMLQQKGIKLAANDTVVPGADTPMSAGMTVQIWREGVQTATVEEVVPFPVRTVLDMDEPVGYHAVQTPGVDGKKNVVYAITAKGGKEISRQQIQSVVTLQPVAQVEIVGAKPGNGLSKSKGADFYTDSKGVTHRETYYDLPMSSVMGLCGGGTYTIRADGAKIDKNGYVLVAANLSRYPRCSIVETSIGLGKVYDTGSFVSRYPDGFDLATDWSNGDGR